jgi:molybdopterin synthase sulfur carrier subunit
MAVKVLIPTPLRNLTGNAADVSVEAKDIAGLLAGLESKHPGIKERLCDDSGKLRRFVNVYLNEEDIRFLQAEATALKDGDEVSIVPAIAGGR